MQIYTATLILQKHINSQNKINKMTITHDTDEPKTACNCWMQIKECACNKK
jgi:hypothetical protein